MPDAIVVGGGFFGLYVATHLKSRLDHVVLCERASDVMTRASYANQARVHNGYHYPRSILTALRSRVNFPRFIAEFAGCIDQSFEQVYAIGRIGSQVSAEHYRLFMRRIGAPIERAPKGIRSLFDPRRIEDVFLTREHAFDAIRLRDVMLDRVERAGVELQLGTEARTLSPASDGVDVHLASASRSHTLRARHVFVCTYSRINRLLAESGLPLVPLKHELAELALVRPSPVLAGLGVTIMCGPFFSSMPFPPRRLHTLSHVRYTPHFHWHDGNGGYRDADAVLGAASRESAFPHMVRDARRFLPAMEDCQYVESIWEVKTVLPRSEVDDSRPILFRADHGLRGVHVILGAKIDNLYDVVDEIDPLLRNESRRS